MCIRDSTEMVIYVLARQLLLTPGVAQRTFNDFKRTSFEGLVGWWVEIQVVVKFPELSCPVTAFALIRAVDSKVVQ